MQRARTPDVVMKQIFVTEQCVDPSVLQKQAMRSDTFSELFGSRGRRLVADAY